jgi:MtN3 and saliva related transmembrane protein
MYAVTVAGFLLWLLYGQQLHSWPLIVTNSICLAFSSFIFIMTVLPQDQKEAVADKIEDNAPV